MQNNAALATDLEPNATMLIVDDDKPFLVRLGRAMETRGFKVLSADSITTGLEIARQTPPTYAVVDMRLEDGNGLELVEKLRESQPDCKSVILTGYGNIATAVSAVKLLSLIHI